MAGEIYTTFTFLGGSGWAYGKGAPAFYILCYGAIAYSLSYFLLPVDLALRAGAAARVAGRLLRRASTTAARSASSSRWSAWPRSCRTSCCSSRDSASSSPRRRTASVSSDGGGLDGRGRARRVRGDLRRARLGVDRGAQGRDDPRRRRGHRDLPAAPLLRRLRRDVRADRAREARASSRCPSQA